MSHEIVNIQAQVSREEHFRYKSCTLVLSRLLNRKVTLGDLIRISLNEKAAELLQTPTEGTRNEAS